jgi:hypothetical protein
MIFLKSCFQNAVTVILHNIHSLNFKIYSEEMESLHSINNIDPYIFISSK